MLSACCSRRTETLTYILFGGEGKINKENSLPGPAAQTNGTDIELPIIDGLAQLRKVESLGDRHELRCRPPSTRDDAVVNRAPRLNLRG